MKKGKNKSAASWCDKNLSIKDFTKNMEASETLTQLPLDFSVTMMNIKIKSEMNNNTTMFLSQNNQQSSSAFKVVTPRGKTDGEFEDREKRENKILRKGKICRVWRKYQARCMRSVINIDKSDNEKSDSKV